MTRLELGDSLEVLKELDENSVDSLVTDPPGGIRFMGKKWDSDKGGRDEWVAWLRGIMEAALRALKPGGHGLVWSIPRTSHWTAWALETAGFEIRDNIVDHIQGQGMAKGANISKAIDKMLDVEREVIGYRPIAYPDSDCWGTPNRNSSNKGIQDGNVYGGGREEFEKGYGKGREVTAPATPEAAQFEGWHSNLKPSQEIWWLVRKPLSEKTIAANVLKWGTGGINVDACRIAGPPSLGGNTSGETALGQGSGWNKHENRPIPIDRTMSKGRWPANVMFSHIGTLPCPECGGSGEFPVEEHRDCCGFVRRLDNCPTCDGNGEVEGCRKVGTKKVKGSHCTTGIWGGSSFGVGKGNDGTREDIKLGHLDPDGKETVEDWECVPGCPVAELDEMSGIRKSSPVGFNRAIGGNDGHEGWKRPAQERESYQRPGELPSNYTDSGTASRFFYQPKAAQNEKVLYCVACKAVFPIKDRKNHLPHVEGHEKGCIAMHPTQKSISLMGYLVKLVTPPGGVVLDPFMGTGSTGVACRDLGFDFIGIDADPISVKIARYRTEVPKSQREALWSESLNVAPENDGTELEEEELGILGMFMGDPTSDPNV
jgi:hypothetical protein